MILLCGVPSEPPLAMVREALDEIGARYVLFSQRHAASAAIRLEQRDGVLGGALECDGEIHRLEKVGAVYTRLTMPDVLPEFRAADGPTRAAIRRLHELLNLWLDLAPVRVVNRGRAMGSNRSKPFQAQIIRRFGFAVPETLVTNDPDAVRAFEAEHGRLIYKSISAVRSIVRTLEPEDYPRLERARWCPVQFQARVPGFDVRVHTVGDIAIATRIDSDSTDYRYAGREPGGSAHLAPYTLSPLVAERCVAVARHLGLEVAGVDLRIAPDGSVYCFEVNPSPAFSFFETATGQPIAETIARHLAERL